MDEKLNSNIDRLILLLPSAPANRAGPIPLALPVSAPADVPNIIASLEGVRLTTFALAACNAAVLNPQKTNRKRIFDLRGLPTFLLSKNGLYIRTYITDAITFSGQHAKIAVDVSQLPLRRRRSRPAPSAATSGATVGSGNAVMLSTPITPKRISPLKLGPSWF